MNGGAIANMYERAEALVWDIHDIARLQALSGEVDAKEWGDLAKSFLNPASLGRGAVPLAGPAAQGVKMVTGQPASNFGSWLRRFLFGPMPEYPFHLNSRKHDKFVDQYKNNSTVKNLVIAFWIMIILFSSGMTCTKQNTDDSVVRRYHKNGKILAEIAYKDGKKNGLSRTWYDNGQCIRNHILKMIA